jgi:hypothetical protein
VTRIAALLAGALLASATVVTLAPPAQAEKTSVEGTHAFTRLVLDNRQRAVVLKMYGPGGGDCSVKHLYDKIRDRDGTRYTVAAGCYPGAVWAVSLSTGGELVDCGGLAVSYDADGGFWLAKVPRGCLDGLADKIKVTSAGIDDYSPAPGEAGPTAYVDRG